MSIPSASKVHISVIIRKVYFMKRRRNLSAETVRQEMPSNSTRVYIDCMILGVWKLVAFCHHGYLLEKIEHIRKRKRVEVVGILCLCVIICMLGIVHTKSCRSSISWIIQE